MGFFVAAGDVLPGKMEQSLSGLQIKVDPRGPFPLADDGNVQVTQPVGAGMILTPLDCDVIVAGAGRYIKISKFDSCIYDCE